MGTAIANANVSLPTGTIYGSQQSYVLLANGQLLRAAAYFYVDRFNLDLGPNGTLFRGAGYTAIHVRLLGRYVGVTKIGGFTDQHKGL